MRKREEEVMQRSWNRKRRIKPYTLPSGKSVGTDAGRKGAEEKDMRRVSWITENYIKKRRWFF